MRQGSMVPCWTKLATVDLMTSMEFYTAIFDWYPTTFVFPESTTPDQNPTQLMHQEGPGAFDFRCLRLRPEDAWADGVAGMYADKQQRWHCCIRVDSLNGFAPRIDDLHGNVLTFGGEATVPVFEFGKLMYLKDIEDADLQIYEPLSMAGNTAIGPNIPSWYELVVADPERTGRFYSELFGWTVYQITDNYWVFRKNEEDIAGMRQLLEGRARWTPFFGVSDLSKAVQTALDAGAVELTVSAFHPAEEVEVLQDPLGGEFGLIELPSS